MIKEALQYIIGLQQPCVQNIEALRSEYRRKKLLLFQWNPCPHK